MTHLPSWRKNLQRHSGFWRDGYWYDLHLERRMPLALEMLDEMVLALPPLREGTRVCDLACGTGNAAAAVVSAYPLVHLTLIDQDPELLAIAYDKVSDYCPNALTLQATIVPDGEPLPEGPYDVVLASLALHVLIGHDADRADSAETETRYELLLQSIRDSLSPGGHLIIGDHVGMLPLYRHLKALERTGFVDVDCAWRVDDFFVIGGRVPDTL